MPGFHEVDVIDTPYARPGGLELLARVYRPRDAAPAPRAALVYVHGGAWARLDRTADAILCEALAGSVANIEPTRQTSLVPAVVGESPQSPIAPGSAASG